MKRVECMNISQIVVLGYFCDITLPLYESHETFCTKAVLKFPDLPSICTYVYLNDELLEVRHSKTGVKL